MTEAATPWCLLPTQILSQLKMPLIFVNKKTQPQHFRLSIPVEKQGQTSIELCLDLSVPDNQSLKIFFIKEL